MDRTEGSAGPPPESQSRLSPVLLWVLLAVVLLRIVTAVMDRPAGGAGEGLVRWKTRDRAAQLSLAGHRPILYDFTAAWCGPCHLLDADWGDASIAGIVDDAFVPVRVVDRQREDGRNAPGVGALQSKYEVTGFPTLVVAAPDGRLLGKLEGYRGRGALLKFLKETPRN